LAPDSILIEVRKTAALDRWLRKLRDTEARARLLARVRRMSIGNFGDTRALGEGVFELRIDHGPGYRVYFAMRGSGNVVLLCAGNKRTQDADILRARRMNKELVE
jgi:putative addiction module killer protein